MRNEPVRDGVTRWTPRQRELVAAASRLFAQRGFSAVSVAEVCGELGLSGPAFYRHFPSKEALLVAVLDECISTHLDDVRDITTSGEAPTTVLEAIVRNHVAFVFDQAGNITTWRTDFANLPPADRSRLRYLQHLYTREWVRTLQRVRPDLDADSAKAVCHAVIALLQAPTESASELPVEAHRALLVQMALTALTAVVAPSPSTLVPA